VFKSFSWWWEHEGVLTIARLNFRAVQLFICRKHLEKRISGIPRLYRPRHEGWFQAGLGKFRDGFWKGTVSMPVATVFARVLTSE
jgi:hypothetical protein